MKLNPLLIILVILCLVTSPCLGYLSTHVIPSSGVVTYPATVDVEKWSVHEIGIVTSNSYSNPYIDVDLSATFIHQNSGEQITIEGFWDGNNNWKIRMAPTKTGTWTYTTTSNDNQLNGKTGNFNCVGSSNKGFIQLSTDHPYTFMHANGAPWFHMGDTCYAGTTDLVDYETRFKPYVNLRASQKFNYVHFTLISSERETIWKNEGGPAFTNGWSRDHLNPGYFQWIDKRVQYLMSKGMVFAPIFAWAQEYDMFSRAQFERYSRYLVARYSVFNVFWILVGEIEEAGKKGDLQYHADVVRTFDPYDHPITTHTLDSSREYWTILDYIMQQIYDTDLNQEIQNDRIYNKPVVNAEYGYLTGQERTGYDNIHVRTRAWQIVTGGGFFVAGFRNTYYVPRGGWHLYDSNDALVAGYLTNLYTFFTSRTNWWEMNPDNSLVNHGFLLVNLGQEYVIYLQSGGSVNVDLIAATGILDVEWYNPRDGSYSGQSTVQGGATRGFTAPDSNDWILHINRQ